MATNFTFTKQDLQAAVTAAAANGGVTTSTLYSFLGVESSGNANTNDSNKGAVGIAQITPSTWQTFFPGTQEPDDPNLQIAAMGRILGSYATDYNGNLTLMAAAYNAGPKASDLAQSYIDQNPSLDPTTAMQMALQNVTLKGGGHYSAQTQKDILGYAANINKGSVGHAISSPDSSTGSNGPGGGSGVGIVSGASVADENAIAASGVSGYTINAANIGAVLSAIAPTTLVISQSPDQTPWFANPNIVQVNGATAAVDAPIKFQVYFTNPDQPLPAILELNASLSRFDRSMRHIRNSQQTRTGILVTLWGMEPDVISGSGSTGLFMNEFGITDFLSVSDLGSSELNRLMTNGFANNDPTFAGNNAGGVTVIPDGGGYDFGNLAGSFQAATAGVFSTYNPPTVSGRSAKNNPLQTTGATPLANHHNRANDKGPYTSSDSMRIAAKDAFMELLALFRQNGMVWFQGSTAGGSTTSKNQIAPNAWSSYFGLSLAQMNARRNDVAARGGVIMTFRNSKYYGYFTNLSWTEDAKKPFSWDFNFTFKVERTSKQVFSPSSSATQQGTATQHPGNAQKQPVKRQ